MKNVEVLKVYPLEDESFKCRVDLSFKTTEFGYLKVKGFRVGLSPKYGGGLWIQAPSLETRWRKWMTLFIIDDKEKWKELKKVLVEACLKEGIDLGNAVLDEDVESGEIDI